MRYSLFNPEVTVSDDETITVDFTESYVFTVDVEGHILADEPDGKPHSTLLDGVLGAERDTTNAPAALRRLAAYIENHQ